MKVEVRSWHTVSRRIEDALYSNVWKEIFYANKNDVRNIIQVIKTYDEYQDKIFEIRSNEIEKEFNIHWG